MDPDAEKPLNSPKIDQVEFDELIAQRVFEKAKAKIAAYYGILGVLWRPSPRTFHLGEN